jgi:hypothetical protein
VRLGRGGARALEVGRERLGDRRGLQVDLEALDVQAGDAAGGLGQRVGVVHASALDHDALAHDPEVRPVEALLGRGLDGVAGRVRRARRRVEPYPGVDRHPTGGACIEHVVHGLGGLAELPCQSTHHVGERQRIAELSLEAAQTRLGRP